jgi:hypothetical protein
MRLEEGLPKGLTLDFDQGDSFDERRRRRASTASTAGAQRGRARKEFRIVVEMNWRHAAHGWNDWYTHARVTDN